MMISTHVLDTARGRAAESVSVELDLLNSDGWHQLGRGTTNAEGRIADFGEPAAEGVYRLTFDIAAYQANAFFPSVTITFQVRDPDQHYHVPLLLSPFGYSTYRGT